jgi:hypothetical protein
MGDITGWNSKHYYTWNAITWINVNTPEIKEGTSRVNYGEVEAIDCALTALETKKRKTEFDFYKSTKKSKSDL